MDFEFDKPICYKPNDDPYPLCVGNSSAECKDCNLYEDMCEEPFYED